jgi:uncharacterized membrane protein YuzA (DUF378 family)
MWGLWEFIVSGRLPGTSVQVSFEHWLYIIAGLAAVVSLPMLVRARFWTSLWLVALGLYAAYVINTDSRKLTGDA